jgi:ferredoxin
MNKNVIFCYSGTGNCLDLAKNIAKGMGGADIIMMRKKPVVTDVTDAETVGFVFPCYGGGAPSDVLEHAKAIRVRFGTYTFGIGVSSAYAGTGLYELNEITPLKYWNTVTHHCSCIWLFPHNLMMPMLSTEAAQKRSEELAEKIAADIKERKETAKKPPHNLFNVVENKLWPVIAKKKIAAFKVSDSCIGCGQCEKLCIRGNIKVVDGKARIGSNCIQCLGCLQYCPQKAISIGKITDKREHYHNPNITADELTRDIINVT